MGSEGGVLHTHSTGGRGRGCNLVPPTAGKLCQHRHGKDGLVERVRGGEGGAGRGEVAGETRQVSQSSGGSPTRCQEESVRWPAHAGGGVVMSGGSTTRHHPGLCTHH